MKKQISKKEKNCVICKIIRGEIPSSKIWENKKYVAILDKFPNTEGMTLVIPKKHYSSYIFDMNKKDYKDLMETARKVAKLLDKKLQVKRTALIVEGLGIDHAHIKLYPLHGLNKKFEVVENNKKVYFEKYEGFVSTQQGPEKSMEELNKIRNKIKE